MCGGEITGVLREDLNFRGLRMLATITFLLLTFSIINYGNYQFSLPPPFLSQKTFKKPTSQAGAGSCCLTGGNRESLLLCHFPPDTLISDYETVSAASK